MYGKNGLLTDLSIKISNFVFYPKQNTQDMNKSRPNLLKSAKYV
ncbi:Uncharacterized protein YR821_1111 [Yersinia ruckeri]|uniref:Uncharacterized protein n=1 Tax=Yersinia ruckeri TaxID=29486 RepID=A0A0A8VBJ9_YERRU|nr:hypothetical protein yruck0001_18300 [Yersinia ruckeri ATCC 29473]QTD76042.1 Uncharacterized protein YR821_1111 [Yersinia ruckeri]CEK26940.1 hypothetical protein CSF007_5915 [Yersinia ruckeri]